MGGEGRFINQLQGEKEQMKRTLSMKVSLLLVMLAIFLIACGGAAQPEPAPEPTEEPAAEPTEEPAAEPTEVAVEEAEGDAVELRFAYYGDGAEPDVMQGLLDAFMADNPDINVVLDVVPYQTIDEQLPIQVETGEGPDMARITNFGVFNGQLLDMSDMMADAAYVRDNFPAPVLDALGEEGGIYGFPDGFTVTGPYVNKTLFEQAEIEMPGPDASWSEWAEATTAVAEATGVQYAISIDRTGHRFAWLVHLRHYV